MQNRSQINTTSAGRRGLMPFVHAAFTAAIGRVVWVAVLGAVLISARALSADDAPSVDETSPAEPVADDQLHVLEQALERDFERFEEKLRELAEYTRRNDPDRAELLVRTRSESTSRRVQAQMKRIADALSPTESGDILYGDALTRQEELIADLGELLKLLQSEDERDRLDREINRLKELLKDTDRLIGKQKDVRADTERGGDASKLGKDQQDVAEGAEQLAEKIDGQDADRQAEENRNSSPKESDEAKSDQDGDSPQGKSKDGEPSKQGDKPEGQGENAEGKDSEDTESPKGEKSDSPDDEKKPGDSKDSESQTPKEGESSKGKPSEDGESSESPKSEGKPQQSEGQQKQPQQGQPGEQQQPKDGQQSQQQQTPGREQLEQAREKMERAIEELKLKRLDKASDEQDAALSKLEEMKAELEEILRQLREEEKKLFLMALEARFQRMLEQQLDINNGTLKLDRVAQDERDQDRHLAQAVKLSRDEGDNATEAEKALMLLREEGTSVAFPEAVEMMRDNMREVMGRLQRGETGDTTQLIERMIVESLEEIVFALQREMEKQDEEKQQQDQQQQEPTDPQLVDVLAELKMIRSLQSQVNRLTRQYGLEIDGEQATNPDDLTFLRNLAGRQERIQDATYDLSIGKNR